MMHIHVDASPDAAGSSEIPRSRPDYRSRLGLGTLVEDAGSSERRYEQVRLC